MIRVIVFDEQEADWMSVYKADTGGLLWEGHVDNMDWPHWINEWGGVKKVTVVDYESKDYLTRNNMSNDMWAAYAEVIDGD